MLYEARLKGETPVIHHAGTGIDSETAINQEISKVAAKKASQRTAVENARLRDLETIKALWLEEDQPAIPTAVIRSCIETAARKSKMGGAVREGLWVLETKFDFDKKRYGRTLEKIAKTAQFTVPVVVQRARILRTRAKFDPPWSVTVRIDTDPDLVDEEKLTSWLDIAGRRIGIGNWRPEKSGTYGRFELESLKALQS